MTKGIEALINIKDSITNDGEILEHTKQYKTIKQELDILECFKKIPKEDLFTFLRWKRIDYCEKLENNSVDYLEKLEEWLLDDK